MKPLRVFVAVPAPDAVRLQAARVIEPLRARFPGRTVRWVPPQNLHLTLRFIGPCSPAEVEAIIGRLGERTRSLPSCTLQLSGLGGFPNDRVPRVLWMGLDGDLEALQQVQAGVEDCTRAWGRPEHRAFHPHLTLARVVSTRRSQIAPGLDAFRSATIPPCPAWPVTSVHLMHSVPAPGGSQYSTLATFGLGGRGTGTL